MTVRNTATLPVSNDFKPAGNAEQAMNILAQRLLKVGRFTQSTAESEVPEALNEAILTQARNFLSDMLTELDTWRAL